MKECQHLICYMGLHPSFEKGWMCADCKHFVDLGAGLPGYAVVFAAFKTQALPQPIEAQ